MSASSTVHADSILIGSLYNSDIDILGDLCKSITIGGIPCKYTDSIEKDLWAKMLYNCLLNPLGAIFNVTYGELAESENTCLIMKSIAEEIFRVIAAAGYRTHWNDVNEYLQTFYARLLPATAKHEASMLQDIKTHRRTEIDAMNGEIVRIGKEYNLNVDVNRTIFNIIKFIESKYLIKT